MADDRGQIAGERAASQNPYTVLEFCSVNASALIPLIAAYVVALMIATTLSTDWLCGTERSDWIMCDPPSSPSAAATGFGSYHGTVHELRVLYGQALADTAAAGRKPKADRPGNATRGRTALLAAHVVQEARQSRAHVAWVGTLGVLIVVALMVSFATVGGVVQALRQYAMSVEAEAPGVHIADGRHWWRFWNRQRLGRLLLILAIAFAILATVFLLLALGMNIVMRRPLENYSPVVAFLSQPTPFFDVIMKRLLATDTALQPLFAVGTRICAAGFIFISLLVVSCLVQSPRDQDFRDEHDGNKERQAGYLRYLGHSFSRLKVAVYLGAALLVSMIAELTAQYAWAVSFIPDAGAAAAAAAAINDFGQQMVTQVGFFFTLLLATLYFPAIMILRTRGRQFHRAHYPAEDLEKQEEFLKKQGLSIEISSTYADFLAMLAPLAAGSATHLLTFLSG